jgi:hypothetical protein
VRQHQVFVDMAVNVGGNRVIPSGVSPSIRKGKYSFNERMITKQSRGDLLNARGIDTRSHTSVQLTFRIFVR